MSSRRSYFSFSALQARQKGSSRQAPFLPQSFFWPGGIQRGGSPSCRQTCSCTCPHHVGAGSGEERKLGAQHRSSALRYASAASAGIRCVLGGVSRPAFTIYGLRCRPCASAERAAHLAINLVRPSCHPNHSPVCVGSRGSGASYASRGRDLRRLHHCARCGERSSRSVAGLGAQIASSGHGQA